MDSTLEEFCRLVLDWRHKTIPRHDLERTASHLRDVVQPQLEELEALRAEKAAREEGTAPKRRQAVNA